MKQSLWEGTDLNIKTSLSKEQLQQENQRLKALSELDGLTGIYNRITIERKINEALAAKHSGAMLLFDLNNFKDVNDQYGHIAGDELLQNVAYILKKTMGNNMVARTGGDEFVIFMSVKQDQNFIEERCRQIRQQFLNLPPDQFMVTRLSVTVCGSIYQKGDDYQRLFDRADQRLITEKSLRKKRPADADNRPENT